ncbi:MAG TPA: hypothetical protein VE081_07165 [Sporichthyaceae bacterium]|nr:hypothetical protein [Sporichthyaceae bacterium]
MTAMAGRVLAGVGLAVAMAGSGHASGASGEAHPQPQPAVHPVKANAHHKSAPVITSDGQPLVAFAANRGRVDQSVRFLAHGSGYRLYVTDQDAVLALHAPSGSAPPRVRVLRLRPVGAAPGRIVSSSDRTHVVARQVWPGIDWVWHGSNNAPAYDLNLAPGVSAGVARFEVDSARSLGLDPHGNLLITTARGVVTVPAPTAWQSALDGKRHPVQARYVVLGGNTFGFRLGAHDPGRPVTVEALVD